MLEEIAKDYAAYIKSDISGEFNSVQDVIDNMLTRLEELGSVVQIIKLKNSECSSTLSEEIIKHRSEITVLSKKISTLNKVIQNLNTNVEMLEKQVEKAEIDFKAYNENKIKTFLKPFLKKNKDNDSNTSTLKTPLEVQFDSVMCNFDNGLK